MDPVSKAKLEAILKKDMSEVTEQDLVFLTARRAYLRSHQLERYGIKLEEDKGKKNSPKPEEKKPDVVITPPDDSNQDSEQDPKGPETPPPANPEGGKPEVKDEYGGGDADPDNPQG